MKAYVIKNKEGKYWQWLFNDEPSWEEKLYNGFLHYSKEDAEKSIVQWRLKDCEVVEVTIGDLEQENAILKKALELAVETITEEGCDSCEFRFKCKKYYGGSTLEDCKNTFIEQAKESLK